MSIASEISRISGNVSDSLDAVAAKGVTVPSGSNSDDLAGLIAQISGGNYVTPEQYGAVGDGTTDDSEAVQDAVDAGYSVYFDSNKTYYLASAVTIDHDCHLFGGEGATIKTATPSGGTVNDGIVVTGTLKKTTTLTTDYSSVGTTANSGNQFTLSDMTGIEIGDLLIIEATDQYYSYARQYYYLGGVLLVSDIYDGHIYTSNSMPWSIENTANVSVKIYSAPTAIIENLNFVSDTDSFGSYNYLVDLEYCKNSIVRNCNITEMAFGLQIGCCVNTLIDCVTVSKSKYDNSIISDGYGICIYSATETIIRRVLAICSQGCVDLGGQIPCINTYIRNCNLTSECRAVGIDMHENSYNIVVEDCTLGGLSLYGTAQVNRCRFIKNNRSGGASDTAIIFRGTHDAKYATLHVENCVFDGESAVSLSRPIPQTPIRAFENIIGNVEIINCVGGYMSYDPTTDSNVTANTIKRLAIKNWADCKEIYHTSGNAIEYLEIADSTFTNSNFLTDHVAAHGVYLDYIKYLDYSSICEPAHKVHLDKTTYGEQRTLPEGVTITLSSSNSSAKYRICGANLTPNVADDYLIGSVTGNVGSALTRSTSSAATVTIDSNGNPVFTQGSGTNTAAMYPVGMVYVGGVSTATITAKIKNTGATSGASFRPYIAIVDCATGLITYRNNGTGDTATASGVTISHTRDVPPNSVVLCYFYCYSAVANSVTTFEDMSITVAPGFIAPVVNEPYQSKRLTGDGTLTSFAGVNNIMCSETTFSIKFSADYVHNPIGLLPGASGVSF